MKKLIKTIDYEWLTKPTGDPFADTGGYVIQYLWENVYQEKDIDELIEIVTKIYVNDWEKSIYFFFPNSPLINSSSKDPTKDTINKYIDIINEQNSLTDYCRISGRRTKVFKIVKDQYILAGSGKLVNYHHNFDDGILLSKEIIIRLLFLPLGVLKIGKYMGLVQSNNNEVSRFITELNISKNLYNISTGISNEIAESDYSLTSNAIFDFANSCISNLEVAKDERKTISITMYHFTNYNQGPDMKLYKMPSTLFSFYRFCKLKYKEEWNKFIRSHYSNSKNKGAKYNPVNEVYELDKKSEKENIPYDKYKTWTNRILNKLLEGKSIVPEFLKWSKDNKLNIDIIRIYQQNIRNMKKETIDKIMELADFIINDRSEDDIKKLITKLDGISNAYSLRRFFMKLVAENYNKGNEEPLISVKDYTNYLFADGGNAMEIRDILLIAIYQKMHELNLKLQVEVENKEID